MDLWSFVVAAFCLSLERICYAFVWRFPEAFCRMCSLPWMRFLGEPIDVLRKLFLGFKAIQISVFLGWCYLYGEGSLSSLNESVLWLSVGTALVIAGQVLNLSVFLRLGQVGVFYGAKFGYDVSWCRSFPFSILRHPQYVGTVLSIWGFFLAMRFPHDDWYILPALETFYYIAGSQLEQ